MTDIDRVKEEIRRMMDEETAIFKEECKGGTEPSACSAVVYTRLQMLMKRIDTMPHEVDTIRIREMASVSGLVSVGHFDSRKEMEREAPREAGNVAQTAWATYCYDGREWTLMAMDRYITFRVVSRHHIAGRGYVTVVHNPDLLPIDKDRSAVCKGQYRLPIHGIEFMMTLMITPKPGKDWGLITSEETIGDYVTIRMYPDEVDEPVNVEGGV